MRKWLNLKSYKLSLKLTFLALKVSWNHRLKSKTNSKPHSLDGKLFFSLTSHTPRFSTLHLTLYCLINQTSKPDNILLWIEEDQIALLPKKVKELNGNGITIMPTKSIRSYSKIIPALHLYPDAYIITFDDDMYYESNLVKKMIRKSLSNPNHVISNRTHLITLDSKTGLPQLYSQWNHEQWDNTQPQLNFLTGICGVLYPPKILDEEVLNEKSFTELAPAADDVWLYWMVRKKQNCVINSGYQVPMLNWRSTQDSALFINNSLDGNDMQIRNMIEHYGFPPIDNDALKPN